MVELNDLNYVDIEARKLYNVFADGMRYNPNGPTSINKETYNKLAAMFGEINPVLRAPVFVKFIKELDDAGIQYDAASFNSQENQ